MYLSIHIHIYKYIHKIFIFYIHAIIPFNTLITLIWVTVLPLQPTPFHTGTVQGLVVVLPAVVHDQLLYMDWILVAATIPHNQLSWAVGVAVINGHKYNNRHNNKSVLHLLGEPILR